VTGRPLLPAVVGPWAAYVIARDYGAEIEKKGEALKAAGQERVGAQLLQAVALMRESGRQQWEVHRGSSDQAGGGSGEVPQAAADGCSQRSLGSGLLVTREVAVMLRVSTRQARNLVGSRLTATLVKGRLIFDEIPVLQECERRGIT
jgi:hypothetical protein